MPIYVLGSPTALPDIITYCSLYCYNYMLYIYITLVHKQFKPNIDIVELYSNKILFSSVIEELG